MILGVLATRVLAYIVFQVTPKDPIVLGGVILTMLAVGLLARTLANPAKIPQTFEGGSA